MNNDPNTPAPVKTALDQLNKMYTPHRKGIGIITASSMAVIGCMFMVLGSIQFSALLSSHSQADPFTVIILGLFPLIGAALTVAAPIAYVRSKQRTERINQLVAQGSKVSAVIKRHNTRSHKQGVDIQFVLEGPDIVTGQTRTYTSDWIGGNPTYAAEAYRLTPISLDVYVSPMNSKEYYVDIRDIPTGPGTTVGTDATPPPTVAL